eukprot:scaffold27277_cov90-Isochrysis_galbana.AAC.3
MPPPPPDGPGAWPTAPKPRFGLSRLLGARLRLRQSFVGATGDAEPEEATEEEDGEPGSGPDGAPEAGEDVEVYRASKLSRAGVRQRRRLALDRSTFSIRQLSHGGGFKWIVPARAARPARPRAAGLLAAGVLLA